MQSKTLLAALAVFLLLIVVTGQLAEDEPDPVLASFERAFDHEPGPAQPARGESIDADELYRTVNSIHWSRDDRESF